jgi:ribosomal protein S18 acetylase RimI-like enzyme
VEVQAITVRAATAEDAAAIARVHVETWHVAYRGLLPEDEIRSVSVEQRQGFWKGELAKSGPGKVDVAEDGAGIIGFCSYGPTRDKDASGAAEIYAVYVHPDNWRRGAGRLLCERARRAAGERGHDALTLWVVKGNERACRFYERIGFAPDGAARSNTRFLKTPFEEVRYRKAIG